MLRLLISLALSLVLAVTSLTMAVARGQTSAAGHIVLCSGAGVVVVPVDAQGRPTGKPHICPDCALSLIVALDLPRPVLRAPEGRLIVRGRPAVAEAAAPQTLPAPAARGPPAVA